MSNGNERWTGMNILFVHMINADALIGHITTLYTVAVCRESNISSNCGLGKSEGSSGFQFLASEQCCELL